MGNSQKKEQTKMKFQAKEKQAFTRVLIRMFTVGAIHESPANNRKTKPGDHWSPLQTNFGRDIVFSADL